MHRAFLFVAPIVLSAAAIACGGDDAETTGSTGSAGAGTGGAASGAGGAGGGGGAAPNEVATAAGQLVYEVTSTIDPSQTCAVTFDLAGVEDRSTPWLCPGCAVSFRSPLNAVSGNCPAKGTPDGISFGWADDGAFHWTIGYHPRIDVGTAAVDGSTVAISGSVNPEGIMPADLTVTVTGELTIGTTEGDPLAGTEPAQSYECGWSKADPPAFGGSYLPAEGSPLPDAVLGDQCGQQVRLHDFLGQYLVIHMGQAAPGCGPCDAAAAGQAAFETAMADLGIATLVVAVIAESYENPDVTPTANDLTNWIADAGVSGVALGDRGFAPAMVTSVLEKQTYDVGWPSFILVAPDGTILRAIGGYVDTLWDGVLQPLIEEHAAMQ